MEDSRRVHLNAFLQRVLKFIPRTLALHSVLAWQTWKPPTEPSTTHNSLTRLPTLDQAQKQKAFDTLLPLPICQQVGEYFGVINHPGGLPPAFEINPFLTAQEAQKTLRVVVMAVRIKGLLSDIGAIGDRRYFTNTSQSIHLDSQIALVDEFYSRVADHVYKGDLGTLAKHGRLFTGDIIQMIGDQILIAYPAEPLDLPNVTMLKSGKLDTYSNDTDLMQEGGSSDSEAVSSEDLLSDLQENLKNALNSASKLHFILNRWLATLDIPLKSKEVVIGLGFGNCMLCHTGGVFNRTNYFAVGEAVSQASDSLFLGSLYQGVHSGIFMSKNFWKEIDDSTIYGTSPGVVFSAEKIHIDGIYKALLDQEKMAVVFKEARSKLAESFEHQTVGDDIALARIKCELLKLPNAKRDGMWAELAQYIPRALHPNMASPAYNSDEVWRGNIKLSNEPRALTVLALILELDGAFDTQDSVFVLQTTIEIVQRQIYKMQGCLSKAFFSSGFQGGGGLQIEAVWGLNQPSCTDSQARAVFAALNIQQALREFIMFSSAETGDEDKIDSSGLHRKHSFKNFSQNAQTNAGTLAGISLLNANDTTIVNDINLPIHVGIASGIAMEAVIGDDNSTTNRLSTGLYGEAHNRARELLDMAQKDQGKIYVDFETAMQARAYINVDYVKHTDSKTSPLHLPVFEPCPIDELDNLSQPSAGINVKQLFQQFESDFTKQGSLLRIRQNPLILDYDSSFQTLYTSILPARQKQVKELIGQILAYSEQGTSLSQRGNNPDISVDLIQRTTFSGTKPFVVAVLGEKGEGKSLFTRNLFYNLKSLEKLVAQQMKQLSRNPNASGINNSMFDVKRKQNNLKFRFCIGSSSPELALQFLGNWKPIIRMALFHLASILDKKPRKVLSMIVEKQLDLIGNKLQFVKDFFHIPDLDHDLIHIIETKYKQVFPQKVSEFHEPARLDPEYEEDCFIFLIQVVLNLFDTLQSTQKKLAEQGFQVSTVVVFILDNASLMNEADWRFFLELFRTVEEHYSNNLVILFNINKNSSFLRQVSTTSKLHFQIAGSAQKFYREEIRPIEDSVFSSVVELEKVSGRQLEQILCELAPAYSKEMVEEIERMIKSDELEMELSQSYFNSMIESQQKGAGKSFEQQERLRNSLTWKFKVRQEFQRVKDEVLQHVIEKSQGTLLRAITYFRQLLIQDFLDVEQDEAPSGGMNDAPFEVVFTNKMRCCLEQGHQSQLFNISTTTMALISSHIDARLNAIGVIYGAFARLACTYVMSAAALFGESFSYQILVQSEVCPSQFIPLSKAAASRGGMSLAHCLQLLERHDLFELVYSQDADEGFEESNTWYRFSDAMMAMILSQQAPFTLFRLPIHDKYTDYLSKVNLSSRKLMIMKGSSDYNLLIRQIFFLKKQTTLEDLDEASKRMLMRKTVSLKVDSLKRGPSKRAQAINLLVAQANSRFEISSMYLDVHFIEKQKVSKVLVRANTPTKSGSDFYSVVEASLIASSFNEEETFTIVLVEVEVRKQILEKQKSFEGASKKDKKDKKAKKKSPEKKKGASESEQEQKQLPTRIIRQIICRIDLEDVGSILDDEACSKPIQAAIDPSKDPKKDKSKKKKDKKKKQEEEDEDEEAIKYFKIEIEYSNQEVPGGRDKVKLRFQEQEEYQKWIVYLRYLKERLQYRQLVSQFEKMTKQMSAPTKSSIQPLGMGTSEGNTLEKGFSLAMKSQNYAQLLKKREQHHRGESSAGLRRSLLQSSFDPEPKHSSRGNTKAKQRLRPEVIEMKNRLKLMFVASFHQGAIHVRRSCIPTAAQAGLGNPLNSNQPRLVQGYPEIKHIIEKAGVLTEADLNPDDTLLTSLAERNSLGTRFRPLEEQEESQEAGSKSSSQMITEYYGAEEDEEEEFDTSDFGEEEPDYGEGSPSPTKTSKTSKTSKVSSPFDRASSPERIDDLAARPSQATEDSPGNPFLSGEYQVKGPGSLGRPSEPNVIGNDIIHEEEHESESPIAIADQSLLSISGFEGEDVQIVLARHHNMYMRKHIKLPGTTVRNKLNQQNLVYEEIYEILKWRKNPYFIEGEAIMMYERDDFSSKFEQEDNEALNIQVSNVEGSISPSMYYKQSVNGWKGLYSLRCQQAKRTFTADEIAQFKLVHRRQTEDIKFNVELILAGPEASKPVYGEDGPGEEELNLEVQRMLAAAITKILDQKSIKECIADFKSLVVAEVEKQALASESTKSLKYQASHKLLKTLKNDSSQQSLLQQSLQKSLSRKGFGMPSNDVGLRSTALLQNYIDNNFSQKGGGPQLEADDPYLEGTAIRQTYPSIRSSSLKQRTENPSSSKSKGMSDLRESSSHLRRRLSQRNWQLGSSHQKSANNLDRSKIQQISQLLANSESKSSLHLQIKTNTIQSVEHQSIEEIKNRELWERQATEVFEGYQSRNYERKNSAKDPNHQRLSERDPYEMKKTMNQFQIVPLSVSNTIQVLDQPNSGNQQSKPLRYTNLTSMKSQRSVLMSQYSMPIAEQENEGSGSPSHRSLNDDDEHEILVSNQSNAFDSHGDNRDLPAEEEKSLIQSLRSLVDKKEQEYLMEQTFNRDLSQIHQSKNIDEEDVEIRHLKESLPGSQAMLPAFPPEYQTSAFHAKQQTSTFQGEKEPETILPDLLEDSVLPEILEHQESQRLKPHQKPHQETHLQHQEQVQELYQEQPEANSPPFGDSSFDRPSGFPSQATLRDDAIIRSQRQGSLLQSHHPSLHESVQQSNRQSIRESQRKSFHDSHQRSLRNSQKRSLPQSSHQQQSKQEGTASYVSYATSRTPVTELDPIISSGREPAKDLPKRNSKTVGPIDLQPAINSQMQPLGVLPVEAEESKLPSGDPSEPSSAIPSKAPSQASSKQSLAPSVQSGMSKAAQRKLKRQVRQESNGGNQTMRSMQVEPDGGSIFKHYEQQQVLQTDRLPSLAEEPINISMGKAVNRSLNRSINKSLNKSVNKSIRSRRDGGDITDAQGYMENEQLFTDRSYLNQNSIDELEPVGEWQETNEWEEDKYYGNMHYEGKYASTQHQQKQSELRGSLYIGQKPSQPLAPSMQASLGKPPFGFQ